VELVLIDMNLSEANHEPVPEVVRPSLSDRVLLAFYIVGVTVAMVGWLWLLALICREIASRLVSAIS
jgi:hypothetical protein